MSLSPKPSMLAAPGSPRMASPWSITPGSPRRSSVARTGSGRSLIAERASVLQQSAYDDFDGGFNSPLLSSSPGTNSLLKPSSRVPQSIIGGDRVGSSGHSSIIPSSKHSDASLIHLPQTPPKSDLQGEGEIDSLPPLTPLSGPLYGYLIGQLSNVLKFGVWWVGFSPLILALFDGNSYLIGASRIAFNLSLLLLSPIAGGIVERTHIKKVLNWTNASRGFIYAVFVPLFWIFLQSGLIWEVNNAMHSSFLIIFLLFVFLDGVTVAFSNVADIDQGGTNLVAAQYGIEIDDNTRNHFNSLHVGCFDGSMVLFTPLLAGISLLIATHLHKATDSEGDDESKLQQHIDIITILAAMAFIFLITTLITLYYYNRYLKTDNNNNNNSGLLVSDDTVPHSPALNNTADPSLPSLGSEISLLADAIKEGAKITWNNHRVRWRVLFFAIETSLEDAVISLIVPEYANAVLAPDGPLRYNYGNLWVAGIIAVGKVGGVCASIAMNKYFRVDADAEGDTSHAYRPLFRFVLLGGLFSLLAPLSYHIKYHTNWPSAVSTTILFIGIFLFFLFSTVCKIGFSTLMQSMAAEADASGRMFGFIASFVTGTDAVLLMILSIVFSAIPLEYALWGSCGFIALHGVIEFIFGPSLVLTKQKHSFDTLNQPLATNAL